MFVPFCVTKSRLVCGRNTQDNFQDLHPSLQGNNSPPQHCKIHHESQYPYSHKVNAQQTRFTWALTSTCSLFHIPSIKIPSKKAPVSTNLWYGPSHSLLCHLVRQWWRVRTNTSSPYLPLPPLGRMLDTDCQAPHWKNVTCNRRPENGFAFVLCPTGQWTTSVKVKDRANSGSAVRRVAANDHICGRLDSSARVSSFNIL